MAQFVLILLIQNFISISYKLRVKVLIFVTKFFISNTYHLKVNPTTSYTPPFQFEYEIYDARKMEEIQL